MLTPLISKIIPKLSTDNDGELVATRNAISRALAADGLDWHDIAAACAAQRESTPLAHARPPSFGDLARAVRDLDGGRLAHHELQFVSQMCARGWSFSPSQRQADWLVALFDRLQRKAAA